MLVSFAHLAKSPKFAQRIHSLHRDGTINLMIDSGAFTLHNDPKKAKYINIDTYCDYLSTFGNDCEKYVMLDVIGSDKGSKSNYELMLKRGYDPMFVFTMVDNDYNYLQEAVKNNEHVCVAGGVVTKGDWVRKRFQDVHRLTKGKIHGLGFVAFPTMYQLPLHSVDSCSWILTSQGFGSLPVFSPVSGMQSIRYLHILNRKKKMPQRVIEMCDRYKITPKVFSDLNNHKGNFKSIGTLFSLHAYTEYQKFTKKKGLNLFLAIANTGQLNELLQYNEVFDDPTYTYEKFQRKDFHSS